MTENRRTVHVGIRLLVSVITLIVAVIVGIVVAVVILVIVIVPERIERYSTSAHCPV